MQTKSWKTTILGVLAIVGALVAAGSALLEGKPIDFAALWPAIMAGFGLIFAKDSDVTGGTSAATPEAAERIAAPQG